MGIVTAIPVTTGTGVVTGSSVTSYGCCNSNPVTVGVVPGIPLTIRTGVVTGSPVITGVVTGIPVTIGIVARFQSLQVQML